MYKKDLKNVLFVSILPCQALLKRYIWLVLTKEWEYSYDFID